MIQETYSVTYTIYADITEIETQIVKLLDAARSASELAHAPYSNFKVGAAVLLNSDTIVQGANQENAAYPLCTCAEQIAIYNAAILHPNTPVKALGLFVNVAHDNTFPPSPCGACRQVILETEERYGSDIAIYISSQNKEVYKFKNIKSLLPFYFSGKDLV